MRATPSSWPVAPAGGHRSLPDVRVARSWRSRAHSTRRRRGRRRGDKIGPARAGARPPGPRNGRPVVPDEIDRRPGRSSGRRSQAGVPSIVAPETGREGAVEPGAATAPRSRGGPAQPQARQGTAGVSGLHARRRRSWSYCHGGGVSQGPRLRPDARCPHRRPDRRVMVRHPCQAAPVTGDIVRALRVTPRAADQHGDIRVRLLGTERSRFNHPAMGCTAGRRLSSATVLEGSCGSIRVRRG